jgi:hypothetical protein
VYVLLDLIEIIIKLKTILAYSYNKWFNNDIAIEYLKHFYKYAKSTEVYRLLVLDDYGSHIIFQFKIFANEYKIIVTGMVHRSAYLCIFMHRYA